MTAAAAQRVFLDTNVLVYAHGTGDEDVRGRTARDIVRRLWRTGTGAVSIQVLQEFYAVATRKLKPPLSRDNARRIVATYTTWEPVAIDVPMIVAASRLEEEHSLAFWDALVIEAALRAGATRLLSEDLQGGRRFDDLLIENPFVES
jgi:predicted nucleic acid-binding protein